MEEQLLVITNWPPKERERERERERTHVCLCPASTRSSTSNTGSGTLRRFTEEEIITKSQLT